MTTTPSPREAETFRAYIKAQDDAIEELTDRYGLEPRDAVRIVHAVSRAAWHRGFHVCADPYLPKDKED